MLYLKSGKQLKTDILLWANGRTGNSDNMNLAAVGVEPDPRGMIKVNEDYQTTVPHIYAVGDVTGPPSLAVPPPTCRQAASPPRTSSPAKGDHVMVREFPTGIYTKPGDQLSGAAPNGRH